MMDFRMLANAAKQSKQTSHKLLVLLAGVTQKPLNELLRLTYRTAKYLLQPGMDHGNVLRTKLREVQKRLGLSEDSLIFVSRKGKARKGKAESPIGRVQAWRIVHAAMASLGLSGAFLTLRRTFAHLYVPEMVDELADIGDPMDSISARVLTPLRV